MINLISSNVLNTPSEEKVSKPKSKIDMIVFLLYKKLKIIIYFIYLYLHIIINIHKINKYVSLSKNKKTAEVL